MTWVVVGVVSEGEAIDVDGLNPWNYEWDEMECEPIELPHPQYASQRHKMLIYEIGPAERRVRFAAGELSPNVWGFYLSS
jgi:hypothetical protein